MKDDIGAIPNLEQHIVMISPDEAVSDYNVDRSNVNGVPAMFRAENPEQVVIGYKDLSKILEELGVN